MGLRTVKEAVEGDHFASRGFWSQIEHPELGASFKYPGRLFQCTHAADTLRFRVPLVGEHNSEICGRESHMPREELPRPQKRKFLAGNHTSKHALDGVRVVELGWAWTGPFTTKYLAQFGAEVIKIESTKRPDVLRYTSPYKDGIAGMERGAFFAYTNGGKLSLTLNLTSSRGLEIARKLISKSDVVVENFRPGVIDRMGLGYEELRKVKPNVIMVSISILGRGGVSDEFGGFGPAGGAASGYFDVTGWPDREPIGIEGGLGPGDFVLAPFAVSAIMAALDHRRRTGQGEHIDCNQAEVLANLLATPYLQYAVTGQEPMRMGNRDPRAAPHGAFRCKGEDMWCAIAIFDEQEWIDFRETLGNPPWSRDDRFTTLASRKQHEDELERLVEEWTLQHSSDEVMALLQSAGVKAGVVATPDYLFESDPQLRARDYFVPVTHSILGTLRYPSPPVRLSLTPHKSGSPPCLGEHNEYVCCQVLGIGDQEFAELVAEGVLE